MSNNIGIVWTSDTRAIFADMQRQIAELKKVQSGVNAVGSAGKTAAANMLGAYNSASSGIAGAIKKIGASERDLQKDSAKRLSAQKAAAQLAVIEEQKAAIAKEKVLRDAAAGIRGLAAQDLSAQRAAAQKSIIEAQKAELAKQKVLRDAAAGIRELRRQDIAEEARLDQKDLESRRAAAVEKLKDADAVRSSIRTKQEAALADYKSQLSKLQKLRDGDLISIREHNRARALAHASYVEDSGVGERLAARRAAREKEIAKQITEARNKANAQVREGKQLLEQYSTAWERHNIKIAHYRDLLKAGAIDQQTFNRAMGASRPIIQDMNAGFERYNGSLREMIPRLAGVAGGFMIIRQAVQFVTQANKEQQSAAEAALAKHEEMLLRLRSQAGLNPQKGRDASVDVLRAAIVTSSTSDEAYAASTAFASSGFSAKEATGGSLMEYLKLKKAQSLDPTRASISDTQNAEGFSKFLAANKQEKNAANVGTLAVQMQGLKETLLKITDLPFIARHSSIFASAGITPESQLAIAAHLVDNGEDAEMAGTHMRIITSSLANIRNNPKEMALMSQIGLKADDANIVDGDIFGPLEKIDAAIKKKFKGSDERRAAYSTLFEERASNDAMLLSESRDAIDKLRPKMRDKGILEKDYELTSTGKLAGQRRRAVMKERENFAKDSNSANDRDQMELSMSRTSPYVSSAVMGLYDLGDRLFGHEGNLAVGAALTGSSDLAGMATSAGVSRVFTQRDNDEIVRGARRDRADVPRGPLPAPQIKVEVQVNMPGQGEKPPAQPAAGLGGN